MAKPSYYEQLKDPRWQKKRLQVLDRDGFACRHCGRADATLNVHHLFYRKGCAPWEYDDSALKTLCKDCHETAEWRREVMLLAFGLLDDSAQAEVVGYAAAKISGIVESANTPSPHSFFEPCDDCFGSTCLGFVIGEMSHYAGHAAYDAAENVADAVMNGNQLSDLNSAAFTANAVAGV